MLPWINTTAVDQRRALIAAWIAGDAPVAELARRFRVSRKTAHKFINRFKQLGDAGLRDLPRAPRNPRATDPKLAAMIVDAKRNAPLLGPKKIIPTLRNAHPDLPWPAPSTAGAILDREGLVKRRKRSRRSPPFADPFADVRAPNDCWAIDFKGWARTSDGARLDPLTLIDADSRFLSEALVGEPVGLVRHDDRNWAVRFGHLEIGLLDGQAMRIIKTPGRALPMYPG